MWKPFSILNPKNLKFLHNLGYFSCAYSALFLFASAIAAIAFTVFWGESQKSRHQTRIRFQPRDSRNIGLYTSRSSVESEPRLASESSSTPTRLPRCSSAELVLPPVTV